VRNQARLGSQLPRNIPVSSDCHYLVSTAHNIRFWVTFERSAYEQARPDISVRFCRTDGINLRRVRLHRARVRLRDSFARCERLNSNKTEQRQIYA
jgi:hypothetical protein